MNNLLISLIVLIVSFTITVVFLPRFIPLLHKLKFGQSIREDGPKSHLTKQGTPTMGGIVFVLATILAMLIVDFNAFFKQPTISISIVFIGFFTIGLIDDLLIVVKKKNDGLSVKAKLLAQILVTCILFVVSKDIFFNNHYTTLSFFQFQVDLSWFYFIFALVMFVAYSNAFNLTDGLDGLASITSVIAFSFLAIIAYDKEQYFVLTYIFAINGALLGFYIFNKKPAKIFMGDTGSLALGGFYAICALLLKVELLSILIGGVFVLETLSVVIQVLSYKIRKKRVFKMAPIHHHFEMGKLKEQKTVYLFYIMGIIFGLLGMVIYFV